MMRMTPEEDATMPLSGIRVLELGHGDGLAYCGKLFADFGADVIKIEPPHHNPDRLASPLLDVDGGIESGHFAWLNTNKRSVAADMASPDGLDIIRKLAAAADVLLDSRTLSETAPALSIEALRVGNHDLIATRLSWFGQTGPYAGFAATDAVCRALAGLFKLTGPAEGPPVLAREGQTGIIAGLNAFLPTIASLLSARRGRTFAVSIHEALVGVAEYEAAQAFQLGASRPRRGLNRFGRNFPLAIYPTRQGWLGVTVVTPAQWRGFCELIDLPELIDDPRYAINLDRIERATELDKIFAPIMARRTAQEWFDLGLEKRIPFAIVPTMAELLDLHIYRDRGTFVPVSIGSAAFQGPIVPLKLEAAPPHPGGRAPLAGEHQGAFFGNGGTIGSSAPRSVAGPAADRPLKDILIIDLTMGWAGPFATRHLADLGAEIVKVEACQHPDWFRGVHSYSATDDDLKRHEKTYWFHMMNRNKKGVTLDLTTPEGLALLKRLVTKADAIVDNYSNEVLPKLGLRYEDLRRDNPHLITMSMPGFPPTSAWSAARTYGATMEQASGLPHLTGRPDTVPTMNQSAYGDPVGGLNGAAALLVALMDRRRTGGGQHVEISQAECMLPLVAPFIVAQSATGTAGPRIGNRHERHVPHGCFPAADPDGWVVVAIADDSQWPALCAVLGRDDWAGDAALAVAAGRRDREDEIEGAIAAWTRERDAETAMRVLQERGVPAGVAKTPFDLKSDPHLKARGFWQQTDHVHMGPHLQPSAPYRENGAMYEVISASPTLGQHNGSVFADLLDLSGGELEQLERLGIIGSEPAPKRARPASKAAQS